MSVVNLEEDENGDLILPLSDKNLIWTDNGNGSFSLSKKKEESAKETEWVLVECISQQRMRYMVEVPKGEAKWALDAVAMDEAKEFSQKHLTETVVSHRVITKEEALVICDEDNMEHAGWEEAHKIKVFFTNEGEIARKRHNNLFIQSLDFRD